MQQNWSDSMAKSKKTIIQKTIDSFFYVANVSLPPTLFACLLCFLKINKATPFYGIIDWSEWFLNVCTIVCVCHTFASTVGVFLVFVVVVCRFKILLLLLLFHQEQNLASSSTFVSEFPFFPAAAPPYLQPMYFVVFFFFLVFYILLLTLLLLCSVDIHSHDIIFCIVECWV